MMRFKVDENLPIEATELLRQGGHDALSVQDQGMVGERDERLADVCKSEGRALVTIDLDFSDIRNYPPDAYSGIIVLRPAIQSMTAVLRLVTRLLGVFGTEQLAHDCGSSMRRKFRIRSADSASP